MILVILKSNLGFIGAILISLITELVHKFQRTSHHAQVHELVKSYYHKKVVGTSIHVQPFE
jgi:hypothetical protein